MTFADGTIVSLGPSGYAPELRCYVESDSGLKSEQLVNAVLNAFLNSNLKATQEYIEWLLTKLEFS